MKPLIVIAVSLLACLSLTPCVHAATADDTYREALLQETTTRDLEKAIALYDEVIKDPQVDRPLKANAYVRWGVCQNKLGRTEAARTAWTQVVENFADQPSAHQDAKAYLQLLQSQAIPVTEPSNPAPRTRVLLEFPGLGYNSNEGGALLVGPAAYYFWKPQWATGVEYSSDLIVDDGEYSDNRFEPVDLTYYGLSTFREWTFVEVIRPYLKAGPGVYRIKVGNDGSTQDAKWTGGLLTEAGLTFAAARGFSVTAAVGLHTIYQPHLKGGGYQDTFYPVPDYELKETIRTLFVPRFVLGYRW